MSTNPEIDALGPNAWCKLSMPYPADPTVANGGKRVACHQWMVDGAWGASSYTATESVRNVPFYRTQSGIQYGTVGGQPKLFLWGGSHQGHPGNDVEILDLVTGVWTQQYVPESPMIYWGLVTATDGVSKVTISSSAPSNALATTGRPTVNNTFAAPNVIAFGTSPTSNQGMSGPDANTPYSVSSYNGTTGEITITGTFTGRKPTVGWTVAIWNSVLDWEFASGFQNTSLSPNSRPYADHSQDWSNFDPVNEALLVLSPAGTMRYSVADKTWTCLAGPNKLGGYTTHPNSDISHRALLQYDPDLAALGNSGFQALVTSVIPSPGSVSSPGKWIMSSTGVWTQRMGTNTATKGLPPEIAPNSGAQMNSHYCPSLAKHIVWFLVGSVQTWYLYDAVADVWTKLNGTPFARMGLAWDDLNEVVVAVEIPAGPTAVATVYVIDVSSDPVGVTTMTYETMHPVGLSGQTGVTINLLKWDDYHKCVLFCAPLNGATGSGGAAGTPFEIWAYKYVPENDIPIEDWATRSAGADVVLALKAEDIWSQVNPAVGAANEGDTLGFFGASFPENPPTLDEVVKASGTASFRFRVNTSPARPPEIRILFSGPPAVADIPVISSSIQAPGTYPTQFGAEFEGGDGSGGDGNPGAGIGSEFYFQYRLRYDARILKGYAAGGPQGGGGTPRIAVNSITWSAGTATVTVSTTDLAGWTAGNKRGMLIGGASPSGYNSVDGIPVIMTRIAAPAGTLVATFPLASDPGGTSTTGFLYDASPGLKQYILYSQPNDSHGAYGSNTNLGLVQSSEPQYFPDISITNPRYLLGSYIGPGAGNTVDAGGRVLNGVSYVQFPNDIGGGPHVGQSGLPQTAPYWTPVADEWAVINGHIKVPHWHRAPGGGNAVPAFSRLPGLLLDNGKGGYGYKNSPDPIGLTAPDKVVRSSGSWIADGVALGAVFGIRGTGVTLAFYRVTAVSSTQLTVEKVTQSGAASAAGLPTITPRASSNVSNSTLQLLPAGVFTVGGGVASVTLPLPLTDTDVVAVSPFLNKDQDGPLTFVGINTNGSTTPASGSFLVLTGISNDLKTLTFKTGTGAQPTLTNGLIYGITGVSRSWRDSVCEMWWSRDGGPRRRLFNPKWRGPAGESSPNDRLGCQFWQEDVNGMFGLLNILAYFNGINSLFGASSDGYMWVDEIIVSKSPIGEPPAAGASAPPPPAPTADFVGTNLTGAGSVTTQFTDQSTNNPTSWAWTFGDSGTSTLQNPSHTYSAEGSYTVTLTATNAAGSSSPFSRVDYVTVTPEADGPITAITSPANGATVSGALTVTVTATDVSGVDRVGLYVDGVKYGADDLSNPYSFSVDTTALANGTHTLAAQATDSLGNVTMTANTSITVLNIVGTTPPTVAITSPLDGASITGNITVAVTATDEVAVTQVDLYIDGGLVASDISAPFAFTVATPTLDQGTHTFQAKAYNAAGNEGVSNIVTVTVVPAPTLSAAAWAPPGQVKKGNR